MDGSFTIESYYAKQNDGFVYYYWRVQGSQDWNVHKTAMKEVPTANVLEKVLKK